MKNEKIYFRKNFEANVVVIFVFIFFFLTKVLDQLNAGLSDIYHWIYNDWLIDYSAGFVRRGLSGELVRFLSQYFEPQKVIGVIIWGIYLVIVVGYLRLIIKSHKYLSPIVTLSLLFLPSLISFYLYDYVAILGRKEMLGYIIVLFHLFILEKTIIPGEISIKKDSLKKYFLWLLPITLIFLPVHILIHESSFLLFVPIHFLISYQIMRYFEVENKNRLWILFLFYVPVLLAFAVVFLFGRVNFATAYSICVNLELRGAFPPGYCNYSDASSMWALPEAITQLPWSFSQAFLLTQNIELNEMIAWVFVFLFLGIAIISSGKMILFEIVKGQFNEQYRSGFLTKKLLKTLLFKYLTIPLLISLPVYIVGIDFGRWFTVTCMNFVMVFLSKEIIWTELNKTKGNVDGKKIEHYIFGAYKQRYYLMMVVFIVAIIFIIKLRPCCIVDFLYLNQPFHSFFKRVSHQIYLLFR